MPAIIGPASEGISAEDLETDISRLEAQWKTIDAASADVIGKAGKSVAPKALYEADLLVRVVRDLFSEDFTKAGRRGQTAWSLVERYIGDVAPDLMDRVGASEDRARRALIRSSPTASTSNWPRPSTARCGCPRAARSSSSTPRR